MKKILTRLAGNSTALRHSSYSRGPDYKINYELRMNDLIQNSCERNDSAEIAWFEEYGRSISFGEMNSLAAKMGCGFLEIGLQPGDRIGILGPNQPNWLVTKWAAYKAGLQLVTLNPLYTSKELEYTINKVGVKTIVCPQENERANFHDRIRAIISNFDQQGKGNIKSSNVPTLSSLIYYDNMDEFKPVFKFDDLFSADTKQKMDVLENINVDIYSPANIQFTSGTTGSPKAASISHFNIINNILAMEQYFNIYVKSISSETRILNMTPLFHVFGFIAGSALMASVGGSNHYPAAYYSSKRSLETINRKKSTTIIGTPTMLIDILSEYHKEPKKYNITSVDRCGMGGAPVSPSLVRDTREAFDAAITVAYGMTENTCATISVNMMAPDEVVVYSVGYPIPGVEIKIVDPVTLNETPQGEVGEICTRGHTSFSGYLGDEKKTKESYLANEWFRTGDLGLKQANGTYQITGREKDMIIRGGENIQPTEIENYINSHENIDSCYVIGVPNKRLGEAVAAYVKLKDGITMTPTQIREFSSEGLAKFKIPKHIKLLDDFPLTPTGKVKKFILRNRCLDDFPELKKEL